MYRVLYRKWRPRVFADVIGQPQVTKTLSNQIREHRLSHAYLFTGSRGTGKTTCAKILAKAVNCLHPVDGDPCNECAICKGIDNGTVLDIVEMDAASNNGVDDIRLLRDEVNFTPSQATYRVYIIDEVHMLSTPAFNALLKTLEEPPEHVKFILATTEVHKLPATILSRCQRFDFRRIEPSCIADRLVEIAKAENAALDYDAAVLIARIADGGMRDALSLLDRCLSVANDVTVDVVSASAGLMSREYIYELMDAVAAKDTARCLSILDTLHKASCDTERLCTELIDRFRSFLIIKTVQHPENLIVCTAEELERIKASAQAFTGEYVLYALGVLAGATEAIRRTQNRRIEAEMALIRLCRPDSSDSVAALTARIAELEKELTLLKKNGVPAAPIGSAPAATPVPSPASAKAETPPVGAAREEPSFDDAPPPDEAPPLTEGSSFKGPQTAPPTAAAQQPPTAFNGFAAEKTGATFADQFAAAGNNGDDEPYTFNLFAPGQNPADEAPPSDEPAAPVPENPPAANVPAAPAPPQKKTVPTAAVPRNLQDGPINGADWQEAIYGVERRFRPLIGTLEGSAAWITGDTLHIRLREESLKLFVNRSFLDKYVNEAAQELFGRQYHIKLE